VVAYPTETFYGLGVNAFDEAALARLRVLKGRDAGKPISVLIDGPAMLDRLCVNISPLARRLMAEHWPGPLTLALAARRGLPKDLVSDGCVAVRHSPHPTAQALVVAFGGPVTTTSANLSGEPALTRPEAVEELFQGRCRVLYGGTTKGGAPSTLARVRGERIEILRPGAIQLDVG